MLCNGQDIIKLASGESSKAQVLEINDDIIKYKLLDSNGNDNVIIIRRSEVSEFIFENGTVVQINAGIIRPNMNYKQYRKFLDYKDYSPWEYDPYNPGVSGTLSFFIPGLGQFVDYEYGRAAIFFFGSLACLITGTIMIGSGTGMGNDGLLAGGLTCLAGDLALRIIGTVDAIRVAKVKNLYERRLYDLKSAEKLSINPVIYKSDISKGIGVGLSIAFNF